MQLHLAAEVQGTVDEGRRFASVKRRKTVMRSTASSNNFVDRDVVIVGPGPHGHATRATGLQSRCAAFLPKAIGRRRSRSAMLAAKQDKAQQELPKSICQPWHVSCRFIWMGLAFPNNGPEQVSKR